MATITQADVTRVAKGMRAAGIDEFSIKVEKLDGTKVSIVVGKAGDAADDANDIDAMIRNTPNGAAP